MPAKTAQAGLLFVKSGCTHIMRNRFFLPAFLSNGDSPAESCMHYWLMKSEPDEVSFDDVLAAPAQTLPWFGVRNYQARNFMRDQMQPGDGVLFYHSSCAEPGVAGIAEVASAPYPDESQFEQGGKYFDPKASRAQPRWISVDVHGLEQGRYLPLSEMRAMPELEDMVLLQKGSRLSISPVTAPQWKAILKQVRKGANK
jgi:predicted RNA-binding protein with PUA-like domain